MTSQKFPVWIWACAALTALLSLYSIFKRNEVETANRSVSLAVEMDNVQALAASQGITVAQALAILKKDGLESIVLTEDSVASLISEGRAAEVGGKLTITDPTVQPRVDRGEQIRLHGLDPAQAPVWLL